MPAKKLFRYLRKGSLFAFAENLKMAGYLQKGSFPMKRRMDDEEIWGMSLKSAVCQNVSYEILVTEMPKVECPIAEHHAGQRDEQRNRRERTEIVSVMICAVWDDDDKFNRIVLVKDGVIYTEENRALAELLCVLPPFMAEVAKNASVAIIKRLDEDSATTNRIGYSNDIEPMNEYAMSVLQQLDEGGGAETNYMGLYAGDVN